MVISAVFPLNATHTHTPLIKQANSNLFLDKFIAAYTHRRRRRRLCSRLTMTFTAASGAVLCTHRFARCCPASNSFYLFCRLSHAHTYTYIFRFIFRLREFMAKDTGAKPESCYSTYSHSLFVCVCDVRTPNTNIEYNQRESAPVTQTKTESKWVDRR